MLKRIFIIVGMLFVGMNVVAQTVYYCVYRRSSRVVVTTSAGLNLQTAVSYTVKVDQKGNTNVSLYSGFDDSGNDCPYNNEYCNPVNEIGRRAFDGCRWLTGIKIPNSVKTISGAAFRGCTNLTSISIPNSVQKIYNVVFDGCTGLTSVDIGSGVESIGEFTFSGCTKLTTIKVNPSNRFFSSVDGILFNKQQTQLIKYPGGKQQASYVIPKTVASIDDGAFEACSNLTSIDVDASNSNFASINGVLYDKSMTTLIKYPAGKTESTFIIPNTITFIAPGAFASCTNLNSIVLPNSVKEIGEYAFWNCTGLESIVISNDFTQKIAENAFLGCNNLQEVHVPTYRIFDLSKMVETSKIITHDDINEVAPKELPLLLMVDGSLSFRDGTNNNCIDADEQCMIRFNMQNIGKGVANNCEVRTRLSGTKSGIMVNTIKLPQIASGQTCTVQIPVKSNLYTIDGEVTLSIDVFEPHGLGVAPFTMTIKTKAYESPYLQIVDYNIASTSGVIKKMEPFTLTMNLQNTKYGKAENVHVKINLPANIFVMSGETELSYPLIKSGEAKPISIQLVASNNFVSNAIPISIDVQEKHGKYAENKQLNIAINQVTSSNVTIAAKEEQQTERKEIQIATLTSEIDRNIPTSNTKNSNTFVVIIANENYQQVASVPYALNDGTIFKKYCEQTLGIPTKNIHIQTNATGNQIKSHINWLSNVVEVFDSPNIIFYYAGHGIPDENTKSAYLLPVDGTITDLSTCYKLDDLYATLGDMPASRIVVFLDACFSGSKREDGMLASARGVALKSRPGQPKGNMIVFSAAQGNETAYPYNEQRHGMFTYYLLKKLQESKGDVTMAELGDYIVKKVSQQSIIENNKKQTPNVTPSPIVGDSWQNWKIQ